MNVRRMMGWLVAGMLLLGGCTGPHSRYSILGIDLSGEENLKAYLVTTEGQAPLDGAGELYKLVKTFTDGAKQTNRYGSMPEAIRLYFEADNGQDFRQQFFVITKEDQLYISYSPLHSYTETFQLPERAYEAVRQAIYGK